MIYVVGLGPGSPAYILPRAIEVIEKAEVVIGASRHLEAVKNHCSSTIDMKIGLGEIGNYLQDNEDKDMAVVVSGDTGFHSLLAFVKRYIDLSNIEVVPGISSLQYMYSRLKKGYEEDCWVSIHGRQRDLVPFIQSRRPMGILTDQEQNNQYIAKLLKSYGTLDASIYIGERLSYEDEKITCLTLDECLDYEAHSLSVVVVAYEG